MPALKESITGFEVIGDAKKEYTVEDIYQLPEGHRAELLDGEMFDMAAPTRTHQQIAGYLYRKIADYTDSKGGSCEVDIAPFAVFLNDDDRTYVEPDVIVVCDPGKLDDAGCHGAPDWVIEVVSSSSVHMDYMRKLFEYRRASVREYWIVDPIKGSVTVYNFEKNTYGTYTFDDTVPAGIYEDLSIDMSQVRP